MGLEVPRYKKADQSITGTTPLEVTDLAWSIDPGGVYELQVDLLVTANATTDGIRVALSGPASPDAVTLVGLIPTSATAVGNVGVAAYDTNLVAADLPSTTVPAKISLHAFIDNGANGGRLKVMASADAVGPISVKKGSFARLVRVN
jgi:hypothetical protein